MQSIIDLLHRAEQNSRSIFANVPPPMGAAGITLRQYSVLAAIETEPGLNQTQLTEITSIDRSTLADIVRRMGERGLVKRIRTNDDKRNCAVTLTEKGKSAAAAMRPVAEVANSKLLQLLGDDERAAFLKALEKLAHVQLSVYAV